MIYELSQKFFFEAAHTLQRDIDAEGSRRIHGHTYHAEIAVSGQPRNGMVIDLGHLRARIEVLRLALDHRFLDDVEHLGPATLENLCAYIYAKSDIANITWVSVERPASGDRCVIRPTSQKD